MAVSQLLRRDSEGNVETVRKMNGGRSLSIGMTKKKAVQKSLRTWVLCSHLHALKPPIKKMNKKYRFKIKYLEKWK